MAAFTAGNTFSLWILPRAPVPDTIRLVWDNCFGLWLTSGRVKVTSDGGRSFAESADNAFAVNKWVHLYMTRTSDGKTDIYINGRLHNGSSCNSGPLTCLGPITVDLQWGGCVDDIRTTERVFRADEILEKFNRDPLLDRAFPNQHTTLPWLYNTLLTEYSQFGEETILEAILSRIGTKTRACLEVGAADGIKHSNTRRLAQAGWETLWIEADDDLYAQLVQNALPSCHCLHTSITVGGDDCLDAILQKHRPGRGLLDLLVIDIDGGEYDIWEQLNHRARIMVIEHAADFPPVTAEPKRNYLNQVSWKAIEALAERKGYSVVARTPCNSVCVEKTAMPKLRGHIL
jgi:hypothetical protein